MLFACPYISRPDVRYTWLATRLSCLFLSFWVFGVEIGRTVSLHVLMHLICMRSVFVTCFVRKTQKMAKKDEH